MPTVICPNVSKKCDCTDSPILNLTAEPFDCPGFLVIYSPPRTLDLRGYFTVDCRTFCFDRPLPPDAPPGVDPCSLVIGTQARAILCAQREAVICNPDPPIPPCPIPPCPPIPPRIPLESAPALGQFVCPDGAIYFYPVAAGAFIGFDQAVINLQAQTFATEYARQYHFCLNVPCLAPCVNSFSSFTLLIEGGNGPFTTNVIGALPPGMTLLTGQHDLRFSGIPTVPGPNNFQLQIFDAVGGYLTRDFTVNVLSISPSVLPDYEVGVPYSVQLTTGGPGSYAWKIESGALPTGLTMSLSGLISGTVPLAEVAAFQVSVIDLACQNIDRTFFIPRVALRGRSQHTIATVLGYPEYIASSPPKKYKQLTWAGTSEQTSVSFVDETIDTSGAKYEWTGTGEINNDGTQISNYAKNLYAQCFPQPELYGTDWPQIYAATNVLLIGKVLKGYCNVNDPNSCPACLTPFPFQQNVATNNIYDTSDFLRSAPRVVTAASLTVIGTISIATVGLDPEHVSGIPSGTLRNEIIVHITDNYSAVLSDEYTDAIALAHAVVYNSNGLVAQTAPRTTGFISRFTSVAFDLQFSNLVMGEIYSAVVQLWDSNGVRTIRAYTFTAAGATHTITDTVPTPAAGHTIEVRTPAVRYA